MDPVQLKLITEDELMALGSGWPSKNLPTIENGASPHRYAPEQLTNPISMCKNSSICAHIK